jgi:quinol monooxygenase YgiN
LLSKFYSLNREHDLFSYQLRIELKKSNINEFVEFLASISDELRKEQGCLELNLYRDIEQENNYGVVSEWNSQGSMEQHFKRKNFSLLLGAAKVLGESFEIKISETSETGDSQLAREKITLQDVKTK